MATKPLGTLVNDTVSFSKKHLLALLIGAVVFGFLTQGVRWWFMNANVGLWQGQMMRTQEQVTEGSARLQELIQKAQTGQMTDAEQKEMEALGQEAVQNAMQGMNRIGGVLRTMLPALGLAFLLSTIVGLLAKSYFVVLAVKGMTDPGTAVQVMLGKIFPLIGLWIWLIIRTFIWIPFIGIIIAIILGPRFALSPIYLLDENKGVTESARLSMRATTGHWGKIIGNVLVVGIVLAICAMILTKILIGFLGLMIGGFVAAMIMQLISGVMAVFVIYLGRSVMQAGPRL